MSDHRPCSCEFQGRGPIGHDDDCPVIERMAGPAEPDPEFIRRHSVLTDDDAAWARKLLTERKRNVADRTC